MQEAITKLDNFSKALRRIKTSAKEIGELHNNLTILLQEETMIIKKKDMG